jgi:uncharacterized protein (DUF1697 family)
MRASRVARPMKTYIALFRGINVGGHHMLPMKQLTVVLEQNDCLNVRTYIQSGNVIFRSATSDVGRLSKRLAAAISKSHGFEPELVVLTQSELETAAAGNPFPEAIENPKSLHLFFLAERPKKPDLKACEALKAKTERFALKGTIFYLHTPEGFGTSKLAARAEKFLGVPATARNWRTVMTLLQMAQVSG